MHTPRISLSYTLQAKFNSEEKKYKLENKRAVEDKMANESALKEIINQQEDEYEDELRQLIQVCLTTSI
ncbi:hypothetical protein EON64_08335 [archaeon]|nr:MAG: hypothetical protein EON64_08335 [archaeon]